MGVNTPRGLLVTRCWPSRPSPLGYTASRWESVPRCESVPGGGELPWVGVSPRGSQSPGWSQSRGGVSPWGEESVPRQRSQSLSGRSQSLSGRSQSLSGSSCRTQTDRVSSIDREMKTAGVAVILRIATGCLFYITPPCLHFHMSMLSDSR